MSSDQIFHPLLKRQNLKSANPCDITPTGARPLHSDHIRMSPRFSAYGLALGFGGLAFFKIIDMILNDLMSFVE